MKKLTNIVLSGLISTIFLASCNSITPANRLLRNFPKAYEIPGASEIIKQERLGATRTLIYIAQEGHYSDIIKFDRRTLKGTLSAQEQVYRILDNLSSIYINKTKLNVHREFLFLEDEDKVDENYKNLAHLVNEVLINSPSEEAKREARIFLDGEAPDGSDLDPEIVNLRYDTILGAVGWLHLEGKIKAKAAATRETYNNAIIFGTRDAVLRNRELAAYYLIRDSGVLKQLPANFLVFGQSHRHSIPITLDEFEAITGEKWSLITIIPDTYWMAGK